jgi:hypothetical protein
MDNARSLDQNCDGVTVLVPTRGLSAARKFLLLLTNEPILPPVPLHSVDSECLLAMDKYHGIVEEALLDRLSRPSFFDVAVEVVMGWIAVRIEKAKRTRNGRGMRHWGATGNCGAAQHQRPEHALRATVELDPRVGPGRSCKAGVGN